MGSEMCIRDSNSAGVMWADKDGKVRFSAGTEADGTVTYPTKDGK